MIIEEVNKLTPFERLVYWIIERQSIATAKKQGLPKPWTDDVLLQQYRYCNVIRIEDKVSQWLLNSWYLSYKNHPNMLLACAIARFFNLPSALEVIGFPLEYKPAEIKMKLREHKAKGNTIFNGAYMVRGNDGEDKVASVIDYTVTPLIGVIDRLDVDSFRATWETISSQYGFGSFMAGQVTADLRWALDGEWADAKTWAPLGPGSHRGMNRLLGHPIKRPMTQNLFEYRLKELIEKLEDYLPSDLYQRMEAIDFQNTLCESDKYNRALFGEGRPKNRYPRGG